MVVIYFCLLIKSRLTYSYCQSYRVEQIGFVQAVFCKIRDTILLFKKCLHLGILMLFLLKRLSLVAKQMTSTEGL